ncbi:hypothetical protein [Rhodococcus jostii]|uniref:hypothetical protein n=1 Tax=Rhodococcus jostii TaxID=132919 RepID=UPI00365CE9FA
MRDLDAAFEHQFLHVTQAQREAVIQPHGVADDLLRVRKPLYDESALVTVAHPLSGHPHSQGDDAEPTNIAATPPKCPSVRCR